MCVSGCIETVFQDSFHVPVTDTTGAGDTFTGYFIAGLVSGMDVRECLIVASRAAAIAVTRPGAAASIPTKQEVREIDLDLKDHRNMRQKSRRKELCNARRKGRAKLFLCNRNSS